MALRQSGLCLNREMPFAVRFRNRVVGRFRADLVVEGKVATVLEVGLLLNFGPRPQFKRLLFDNDRKYYHGHVDQAVMARVTVQ